MAASIWFDDDYTQQQSNGTYFGVFNTDPSTIGSKLNRPLNPDSFIQQPRNFFASTSKITESPSSSSAFLEQYCSEPSIPTFGGVSTFPTLSLFDYN
ncbi:hypothetical protein M9Y10_000897 [Tritrichomonas musculus]|uniref:Uncharacterized protein n=1 Tax=Tritrichomonas musculus TaxID=1915356 RepID=A0ABR2L5G5_9EUKA